MRLQCKSVAVSMLYQFWQARHRPHAQVSAIVGPSTALFSIQSQELNSVHAITCSNLQHSQAIIDFAAWVPSISSNKKDAHCILAWACCSTDLLAYRSKLICCCGDTTLYSFVSRPQVTSNDLTSCGPPFPIRHCQRGSFEALGVWLRQNDQH